MTAPADRLRLGELLASWATLVKVPAGSKGPRDTGWNTDPAQWITTPSAAREYLTANPGGGLGLLHSENQTATVDPDDDGVKLALAAVGIDWDELLAANPYRVNGRRPDKPIFRVPNGLSLPRKALNWPDPDPDAPGKKKRSGGRPPVITIFELRGGPGLQDVMPPSIHPVTGTPYTWAGPVPTSRDDLPELPAVLLRLWERWTELEPIMRAACPWAPALPDDLPAPRPRDLAHLGSGSGGGESVIDQFNASRSLGEVLNEQGYKGGQFGPWLCPGSSSGQAGVRLRPERTPRGAQVVMSWHASDPLGDGLPRDAFGVWALLAHGVNVYDATPEQRREMVKAAARVLGLPAPERGSAAQGRPSIAAAPQLPALDWGEVRPLPPLTDPVPPLPAELLPDSLREWIEAEARAAGLPLEGVATPVLGGASGLINRRLSLRNVPAYPPVTGAAWCGLCTPPGAKKSWAIELGSKALERAERAEAERRADERSMLEARKDMATAQLEALQTRLKNAYKGNNQAPTPPSEDELAEARDALSAAQAALEPLRFTVRDATIETVAVLLDKNPYGLMLVRDELTVLLAGFNKPGRESDRAQWLELANGNAVLQVDRITRAPLYVNGAAVGVLGGIQPTPLAKLLDSERQGGDGLLQRFQLFVWPDRWPDFNQAAQHRGVDNGLRKAADDLLDVLPTLTAEVLGSVHPSGDAAPLTYTPEAQAVFNAWELEHERAKRDMNRGEAYRSHISKQPSIFARLALVFHALEVAALGVHAHPDPTHVGVEAAARAADWCEYLGAHARKLWREGQRRDVLDARAVLRFVERGRVVDGQKVAEIRKALSEAREALTGPRLEAALAVLTECGAVREEVAPAGSKGGRPVKTLRLHPDALTALDDVKDGEVL